MPLKSSSVSVFVVKDSRNQEESWSKIRVIKKSRGQRLATEGSDFGADSRNPYEQWSKSSSVSVFVVKGLRPKGVTLVRIRVAQLKIFQSEAKSQLLSRGKGLFPTSGKESWR